MMLEILLLIACVPFIHVQSTMIMLPSYLLQQIAETNEMLIKLKHDVQNDSRRLQRISDSLKPLTYEHYWQSSETAITEGKKAYCLSILHQNMAKDAEDIKAFYAKIEEKMLFVKNETEMVNKIIESYNVFDGKCGMFETYKELRNCRMDALRNTEVDVAATKKRIKSDGYKVKSEAIISELVNLFRATLGTLGEFKFCIHEMWNCADNCVDQN